METELRDGGTCRFSYVIFKMMYEPLEFFTGVNSFYRFHHKTAQLNSNKLGHQTDGPSRSK